MSDPLFSNTTDPRFVSWEKSPQSGGNEGCIYLSVAADGSGDVAVADSKAGPGAPIQVYNRTEWAAFLAGAKAGAFDHI
ncbi:DUF397 domain-containing protein [Micromonospora aurantiaca (nom. illeg.)]|uniref:DUF397 domain-containing protein n=1 Tax=Micromonospora aurantiaca (nom. illeg.) TaxID=47850 RepID=UPI0033E7E2CF